MHFLTPVGRLDRSTGPMLKSEYDAVARGSAALIVLNLSRLSMLTPAGVEVLLQINDASEAGPARLRVINGSRPVARALEITGARERLPVMSPRPAAPTPICTRAPRRWRQTQERLARPFNSFASRSRADN